MCFWMQSLCFEISICITTVIHHCCKKALMELELHSHCNTSAQNRQRTANLRELSTSTLFCGYRLWSQGTSHQFPSPWLKKLQCNGNGTSRSGTLLQRRGKHYCKADTKLEWNKEFQLDRTMTELKQTILKPCVTKTFSEEFLNIHC